MTARSVRVLLLWIDKGDPGVPPDIKETAAGGPLGNKGWDQGNVSLLHFQSNGPMVQWSCASLFGGLSLHG